MLTNKMNLPEAIVRAVNNDGYTRGNSDISVTQLIAPPYQRQLRTRTEPIEDVSDRIWSLVGQAVHTILERAAPETAVSEERLYMDVNGWKVSGQFDTLEVSSGRLIDYKITSVWSVMDGGKDEWEKQLNLLRLLCVENGHQVNELMIVAILRDWSKGKSLSENYPSAQVVTIPIKVWDLDETRKYMEERVRLHQDESPPVCSSEERWFKGDVYAVMKDGRKSAVKLHTVEVDALLHAKDLGKGHTVVKRPGEYTRCLSYCNVAHACPANQTIF